MARNVVTFPLLGQSGRLGNQLWQIASTIGIARATNREPRFPDWSYRPWFSMPDAWFGSCRGGLEAVDLATHLDSRCRDYLQDYSLWRAVAGEVITVFAPSPLAVAVLDGYSEFNALPRPRLSVHVRRGDNVPGQDAGTPDKHNYHPLRPMSYYDAAYKIAAGDGFASIAVFSDDPDWCRLNMAGDYFHEGVARPKEHEPGYKTAPVLDWIDLFLMARCDRHIIGNSTYAWWGAWLAGDERTVYPAPWFGPKLRYIDASLMFPDTWRRLAHAV